MKGHRERLDALVAPIPTPIKRLLPKQLEGWQLRLLSWLCYAI